MFATERLRGDKTRRAGQFVGAVFREPRAIGQAEILDAQFAVVTQ